MKLCSICDKKIVGTWCKNCHRFVKTYDISDGIHFNESHNPRNDAGCTYHTGGTVQKSTVRTNTAGTTAARQTYTQTTTRTQTSTGTQTATQKSAGTGKKKNGKAKLVVVLVILYIVCNFIGAFVPTIKNCVGAFADEFLESANKFEEAEDPFEETPEQNDPAAEEAAHEEKLAALEKLTPMEEYVEATYTFRYYDPRDIAALGFACDEAHFDMKVPEFEEWLSEVWLDSYEVEDEISEYQNYYYESETGNWISFSLYRDYYADDDFAVSIGYDTATQQLHAIGFAAMNDVDATDLYFSTLKKFDPDTDWTQKFFKENLKQALEAEEYAGLYTSDAVLIDVQIYDGYYFINFYPATYEY